MIPFQTRSFLRTLSTIGPTEPRDLSALTRRARLLALTPPLVVLTAGALALDEALYPLSEVQVRQPLFIIGPPRCGTTRLFRLLAMDQERFTSVKAWQILLPSLATQRAVRGLNRLDRGLGAPLRRRLDAWQERVLGPSDALHVLRLDQPEEDELLLLFAFATENWAIPFPIPDVFHEYRAFDRLPEARRRALLEFYAGCVKRHLLLEGAHRQLLSKNVFFCHKVASLRQAFPDARFVLVVRHPAEAVPSLASLVALMRAKLGARDPGSLDDLVQFVVDCYENAADALEKLPPDASCLVRYEDLVASPRAVVEGIYGRFGMDVTGRYAEILADEERAARGYRSRHRYSLTGIGLSHARLEARAAAVYERYGFERRSEMR